jgi:alanine racemase
MKDEKESAPAIASPSSFRSGRPTWAEIDLDNLVHNFRVMRQAVGTDTAIMPAVKADAYGHGATRCALALERAGAEWFGVALPEEGVKLRESGVTRPILCMGGFWEGQEELLLKHDLTPVIFRPDLLARLDRAASIAHRAADYHLKVDTGMGRLGVPDAALNDFLEQASRLKHVRLDGLMTHFASADEPDKVDFTDRQMSLFESAVERARGRGHNPTWIHQANSAATHARPRSRCNLVRLGGVIYGLWRDVTNPTVEPFDWRPVMSVRTRIGLLKTVEEGSPLGYGCTFVTRRESLIATLPIGYADGLRRALSSRGRVIVRGQLAPIVGRVSMDLTILDVTEIAGVAVGDEVVIIGRQGELSITAEDVAAQVGTISYEVTCGISDRVPRRYISGQ